MTWVEKHGMHCYLCNDIIDEREVTLYYDEKKEEHEICEDCQSKEESK